MHHTFMYAPRYQLQFCFLVGNIQDLDPSSPLMVYKNTKLIELLTPTPTATATNSLYVGKVTAWEMMNGLPAASSKIVKSSINGMKPVVTGQALHDTFCQGFKNFPWRFDGRTGISFWLMLRNIIFLNLGGCKPIVLSQLKPMFWLKT